MEEIKNLIGEVRAVNKENRTATFIASTSTKDRHRTVLNQDNWNLDNFNQNGIIGYQHNVYGGGMCEKATPDDVIGKGFAEIREGNLEVDITFKPQGRSEIADKVFEDVNDGFLKTSSVGFLPIGTGKLLNDETGKEVKMSGIPEGHTYHFAGQELLELSVVNIPSNPTALKKAFRESTAFALTYLVKAFGGKYSLTDIDKMTVGNILKLLNNDQLELQYDAFSNNIEDEKARESDRKDKEEMEKIEQYARVETKRKRRKRELIDLEFLNI